MNCTVCGTDWEDDEPISQEDKIQDVIEAAYSLVTFFTSGNQEAISISQNRLFDTLKELDSKAFTKAFKAGMSSQ